MLPDCAFINSRSSTCERRVKEKRERLEATTNPQSDDTCTTVQSDHCCGGLRLLPAFRRYQLSASCPLVRTHACVLSLSTVPLLRGILALAARSISFVQQLCDRCDERIRVQRDQQERGQEERERAGKGLQFSLELSVIVVHRRIQLFCLSLSLSFRVSRPFNPQERAFHNSRSDPIQLPVQLQYFCLSVSFTHSVPQQRDRQTGQAMLSCS